MDNKGWPRNNLRGPKGGLSHGPGGGLSKGPGGGLSRGPTPYFSNILPRAVYLEDLKNRGYDEEYNILKEAWDL